MTKLEKAIIPQSEKNKAIAGLLKAWKDGDPAIRTAFPTATDETILAFATDYIMHDASIGQVFKNDIYQVLVRDTPMFGATGVWLSIKRLDRQPIHDWRDLQEIKNQVVGREHEAVELYPAESRCVDTSNQYHLWCLANPSVRFPLGFPDGAKMEASINGSVQRPFNKPVANPPVPQHPEKQ